jgi:hypothetical protein
MVNIIISALYQILLGYQIKEYEMGRMYSIHQRDENCIQFCLENQK